MAVELKDKIINKVSFVNKINVLMKATSEDDKAVPGYLYSEISNITFESADYCESTLEFLVDRLEKKSCHVKLKVLKVMKYLVENGHHNFRLGLIKQSAGIKHATKYNGPPDPLHGNVPYLMVRKTAQELSELLFNVEEKLATGEMNTEYTSVGKTGIVGIGPSTLNQRTQSRYEGFGNTPSQQQKSVGESIRDGVIKLAEKWGETSTDHQRSLLTDLELKGSYLPPTVVPSDSAVYDTEVSPVVKPVVRPKHIPGRAGGGWDDDDDDSYTVQEQGGTQESVSEGSAGLTDRIDQAVTADWSSEENLVRAWMMDSRHLLLRPSEMRVFLADCANLNCDKVVEFINVQLQEDIQEINLMRGLLLVEALMTSDLVNLEQLTSICRENLVNLFSTKQGPVKSKSRKIIRILEKLTNHSTIIPREEFDSDKTKDSILIDIETTTASGSAALSGDLKPLTVPGVQGTTGAGAQQETTAQGQNVYHSLETNNVDLENT